MSRGGDQSARHRAVPMLMLDLFAGLGGASAAMRARGWRVVTVDIEPRFGCDVTADLLTWTWDGPTPDLLWASPPCTEFSREDMPWCRTGVAPSLSLVERVDQLVAQIRPRWWVLENVRGAQRWIGRARLHYGPVYLWGDFPMMPQLDVRPWKTRLSSTQDALRAKIPWAISEALADAIEGLVPA